MNGKTFAYLDLAALPAVGAHLLGRKPAWVFRGDGTAILWANAAGVRFFGAGTMGDLIGRRIGAANPLVKQLARLARVLPTSTSRLEILRLAADFRMSTIAASCRRLNIADGSSVVLAVAAEDADPESISFRAETLADMIAGEDCLAAIIDSTGHVIGASGGFNDLSPASESIDALVASIEGGEARIVKRSIQLGGRTRPAGAVRFDADEGSLALLIVGPTEARLETTHSVSATGKPDEVSATEQREAPLDPADSEPPAPPAVTQAVRFLWQIDRDQRFTFVSEELARVVGATNADIVGRTWREVADRLAIDRDGQVQTALDAQIQWSGVKTYWPTDRAGHVVPVELSAFPVSERGMIGGQRGFGILRPNDESRDEPESHFEGTADIDPTAQDQADDQGQAEDNVPPAGSEQASDADDAARRSVEEGLRIADEDEQPPEQTPVTIDDDASSANKTNVVRLPGTQHVRTLESDRLSGSERDAFRRIAESLGVREANESPEQNMPAPDAAADDTEGLSEAPAAPGEPDTNVLDRLPIGIVVYRENETLFVNRTLLDLLGYDSTDSFAAIGGAESIFAVRESTDTKSKLGVDEAQISVQRKDGRALSVAAHMRPVDWGGRSALMLAIVDDDRQPQDSAPSPTKLLDEIAAAEARLGELEAILDTATDGVIVIDGRGRICNLNKSTEALFGIDAGEVLGTPFTDLLAVESRKDALDYLDGLASNGVASVLNDGREVIGKVPQGGLIPMFMTMGRLGDTGKFCAVLRDITHWKNVEEELVAARRAAEVASTQKSEFLAKISHEIRTPLNAIIGFSEVMMEERFGTIGNPRYRDYLRDIHMSGSHLMSLINDLLDLSKIEAGKLDLTFEAVALNETIQECVALMQPQANRERIIIRTSLSSGVPNVVADSRSLRQILLNLLSNAIKFTKTGGQVIVSTAIEDNGEVAIRVRDTGVGMSEKDIEMALKPFRQLATSARDRGDGTGLGLPLTKALVEANRASFAIDSAVNQGTLVKITFPTTRVLAG